MVNLNEVLEFIKNSDLQELKQIQNTVSIRKSEVVHDVRMSFRVGDMVGIDHKKVDPKQNFRIIKINNKNIKVQASDVADGRIGGFYTVAPSLLVKK